jgi:hypothetical protein
LLTNVSFPKSWQFVWSGHESTGGAFEYPVRGPEASDDDTVTATALRPWFIDMNAKNESGRMGSEEPPRQHGGNSSVVYFESSLLSKNFTALCACRNAYTALALCEDDNAPGPNPSRPLDERLRNAAREACEEAELLPPGPESDALLEKACEKQIEINKALNL